MIDGSRKWTYWVCAGGILAVTACTSYMNARYGYSQGHDVYEKWVFVIAGVSTDLIKVFGLPFAAIAWAKNFKIKAFFAFTMWLGVFLYALSNAAGFALTARVNKNAEQAFDNDSTKQARTEYMAAFAALEKLREDQDVHKTNQRYLSTAGCTSPENRMTVESRMFCTQYIVHVQKIVEKEKEVESLKKNLPEAKFEKPVDPQMVFFANVTGMPVQRLTEVWSVAVAFLFEVVSGFGMYVISPTRRVPVREEKAKTKQKRIGRPKGSRNKPKLVVDNAKAA